MKHTPVVFLTGEFPPRHGGIGTYVAESARAAAAAGCDVTVGAPTRQLSSWGKASFRLWPLPISSGQGVVNRWKLGRLLRYECERWQHGTLVLAEPLPLRVFLAGGLPEPKHLVVVFHGSELERLTAKAADRKRLLAFLRGASRVGVVSGYVEERLKTLMPDLETPVVRVPGAVSLSLVPATPPVRASKVATVETPLRVLCVGRLHPRKGQHHLLAALRHLGDCPVTVELVGPSRDSTYLRSLRSLARDFGEGRVNFLGPVDEASLRAAYARADVLVFPSEATGNSVEGLGLTLLEGQAWGLPVVANLTGGSREAFGPDVTGCSVDAETEDVPVAIAGHLRALAKDPKLRRRLGEAGPAWVAERFSWARNMEKLLQGR